MASKMSAVLVMGLVIISLISVTSAISGTATYYTVYTLPEKNLFQSTSLNKIGYLIRSVGGAVTIASACYGYQDEGTMIAAASDALYANGAACGQMYKITCTGATNQGVPQPCKGGSVTVKIVDRCPSPGCQAIIDLSQEAFSAIADLNAGKIQIDYTMA